MPEMLPKESGCFDPDIVDVSSGVEEKDQKERSIDKTICNMCQEEAEERKEKMNKKAYYGQFGGQYVAESLMNTLQELDQAYEEAIHDPEFMKQYHYYLKQYVGRETPLYYAERLSAKYGTKNLLKA